MEYIVNRLKEANTWAGIAVFFGMFGFNADLITRITANGPAVITAVASLIAIFAPNVMGKAKNNNPADHGLAPSKNFAPDPGVTPTHPPRI